MARQTLKLQGSWSNSPRVSYYHCSPDHGDQHSGTSKPPYGDLSPLSGLWEREWAVEAEPALHKAYTAVNLNKALLSLTGSFYGKGSWRQG